MQMRLVRRAKKKDITRGTGDRGGTVSLAICRARDSGARSLRRPANAKELRGCGRYECSFIDQADATFDFFFALFSSSFSLFLFLILNVNRVITGTVHNRSSVCHRAMAPSGILYSFLRVSKNAQKQTRKRSRVTKNRDL